MVLEKNSLCGTIPSYVVELRAQDEVLSQSNLLTGTIPLEIDVSTNMRIIDFAENRVTSTMAIELAYLAKLCDNIFYYHLSFIYDPTCLLLPLAEAYACFSYSLSYFKLIMVKLKEKQHFRRHQLFW